MRVVVQPAELDATASRIAADAALLDALLVVARLEAAAAAMPGTQLAAAARTAAERLRVALFDVRLRMAAGGRALATAAERYELVDRQALRTRWPP